MKYGYEKLLHVIFYGRKPEPFIKVKESDIEILVQDMDKALSMLSDKEADILNLYFALNVEKPSTLEEIGAKYNLTRERIRQIKENAIRRLRYPSRFQHLRKYLSD